MSSFGLYICGFMRSWFFVWIYDYMCAMSLQYFGYGYGSLMDQWHGFGVLLLRTETVAMAVLRQFKASIPVVRSQSHVPGADTRSERCRLGC